MGVDVVGDGRKDGGPCDCVFAQVEVVCFVWWVLNDERHQGRARDQALGGVLRV